MMRRWGTIAGVVAAVLMLSAPAQAVPRDTTVRTIQDTDDDNLLEFAPGEDHCVFTLSLEAGDDCAEADLRPRDVDSLLYFLQLSDFQIVDEESPARVEFLDTTQRIPGLQPFSAAHRPQESLTTQTTEAMVRQARNTTSPITGERLDLTILTGDNADSQQHNETRWFIDILDGTTGPENPDPEMDDRPGEDRKIVPDSGRHELADACPGYVDNNSIYDGVRDRGNTGPDPGYYEPDGEGDGDGYTPRREQNFSETGQDVTVRDFPGLFEDAQAPFEAVGLGMPWYTAFGNHDALVQGNSPDAFVGPFGDADTPELLNPGYDAIARGCVKPSNLPAGVTAEEFLEDPAKALKENPDFTSMIVPPDDRRCFLAKDEENTAAYPCNTGGWIQQHSRTAGFPVGHGFEPFEVDGQEGEGRPLQARNAHDGYYSFNPRPGVRFVVLDSVTDECTLVICSEGSIDNQQYEWLRGEFEAAKAAGEYVMTFSHHTLRTTLMESTDHTERTPPTALGQMHHGERFDRKDRTRPPEPVRPDALPDTTLEDLFCAQENFIGHVAGHEHENYVLGHYCEDPETTGKNPFVEVSTAAHIDYPQQSRTAELLTDEDGDLSLALTILDHDGPPNPGGGNAGPQPVKLAAIAREIAYNDYQGGGDGARGERSDRNVIVETGKKWPPPPDSP